MCFFWVNKGSLLFAGDSHLIAFRSVQRSLVERFGSDKDRTSHFYVHNTLGHHRRTFLYSVVMRLDRYQTISGRPY